MLFSSIIRQACATFFSEDILITGLRQKSSNDMFTSQKIEIRRDVFVRGLADLEQLLLYQKGWNTADWSFTYRPFPATDRSA